MASRTALAASSSPIAFYHIRHKSLQPLSTSIHPSNGLPSPPMTPEETSPRSDKVSLSLIPGPKDGPQVKTPSPSARSASSPSSEIAFSRGSDSSATSHVSVAPSVLGTAETRLRPPPGTSTSLIAPERPEPESGRMLGRGLPAAASVHISGEAKDAKPKPESSGAFSRMEKVKNGGTYQEIMAAITNCRDGGVERQRIEVSEEGEKKDKNQKEDERRRVRSLFTISRAFLGKVMNPKGGKSI